MKPPALCHPGVGAVLDGLSPRVRSRASMVASVRKEHCHSLTWLPGEPPDAVVFADHRDDVVEVVRLCAEHGVPVVPFGIGSSMEGQVNAPRGGVCLDLSRMNAIVAVQPDDLIATVQPGVTRKQLNRSLSEHGLFFSVDPGADATIGGMASTRASGTNTVRYGTMRENTVELEVVLADGRIARMGSRARKSSAGYDLARLFVGAEGTLGVITELAVRLFPQPERIGSGMCAFDSIEAAVRTVIDAGRLGLGLARIELLDRTTVAACNGYSGLGLADQVHLFVELHGDDASVPEHAARFAKVVAECGGGPFEWSTTATDRARLWRARHDAWWAIHSLYPGRRGIPTDVCVPVSRLAECILATEQDLVESRVDAAIVGHVGDGNFHLLIMTDQDDPDAIARAKALTDRLNLRAIDMGGTCTGEHGVGQGKAATMPVEHGDTTVEVMRAIKRALDPSDIMNPGKILPAPHHPSCQVESL